MAFQGAVRVAFRVLAATLVWVATTAGSEPAASQAPPLPQQPTQTPVFKSRTDVVRVSVAVIDNKTGKPVTGLTTRDFTVLENGVQQAISTFASGSGSSRASGAAATTTPADAPAFGRGRVFLIMLGGGHIEGPVHPFDGVIRFIRERLLPDDLVSVMAFNRATAFTTDHEQAARVVERLKARRDALATEVFEYVRKNEGRREDLSAAVQADIDAVFQPPGSSGPAVRNITNLLLGTSEFRRNDVGWLPWNRMIMGAIFGDLLKAFAGIEFLRNVEGEKHLVCLTLEGLGGPPIKFVNEPLGLRLDSREDDARLAARANDAHVALDMIHTVGAFRGQAFSIMSSENVSELSGGQFTGVRTADAALANIDAATRDEYMLGYMPANPTLDGKYHDVVVRVNRPGVTLVFPHGYTAQPDPPPLGLRELVTRSRLRNAAATDVTQNDIQLHATASVVPGAGAAPQVRVDLKIDASHISLTQVGARWEGTIDLMIVCGDARQKVVGTLSQQMAMSLDDDHHRQAMSGGIPYVTTMTLTGAATFVKVLVYDFDTDRLGAAYAKLK